MKLMIRFVGSICILASSILGGLYLEHRLRYRWILFRDISELLCILEKEMILYRVTLPEALRETAKHSVTEIGGAMEKTAEKAEKREGRDFARIWQESLEESQIRQYLSAREWDWICELQSALCNTDMVLQKTLLEKSEDHFLYLCKNAEQQMNEKGKLYHRLTAAGGLFLLILLL